MTPNWCWLSFRVQAASQNVSWRQGPARLMDIDAEAWGTCVALPIITNTRQLCVYIGLSSVPWGRAILNCTLLQKLLSINNTSLNNPVNWLWMKNSHVWFYWNGKSFTNHLEKWENGNVKKWKISNNGLTSKDMIALGFPSNPLKRKVNL
jgi:hypothetical protein